MDTKSLIALYASILFFSSHALFFESDKEPKKFFIVRTDIKSDLTSDDFFKQAAFNLPELLHRAKEENYSVILTIPEQYKTISPIDEYAPYNEGSRVALAWASVFFRFDNVDIRVLRVPDNYPYVDEAISSLASFSWHNDLALSKEDQFERRIFNADKLENNSNLLKLKQIKVERNLPKSQMLTPSFANTKGDQKRIVITGGAGFLGSFITSKLLDEGHQVIVLDNYFCCEKTNLKKYRNHQNLKIYKHDISIPFEIEGSIDWIVHLASVPSPTDYYAKPHETLRSGLHGTYNCLKLAVKKNARFFYSSTSEVYGDPEISPQHEEYEGRVNPYGKRCQYDESKRGAETLIKLYYDTYKNLDVRIARIFNTYGPHMRLGDGRVITNFIQAILENKPLIIHGDGNQTRSFSYVSDTVGGLLRLLKSENTFGDNLIDRIFNVGCNEEFTINELAEKINALSLDVFKKTIKLNKIKHIDNTDPKLRKPDISKIRKKLGYSPRVKLDEGLRKTLNHFMETKL